MYAELVGVWIDTPLPPPTPGIPLLVRAAQAIEWPKGEDGTIKLRLTDVLGQPVVLALTGADTLKLYIGFDLRSGAQQTLSGAVTSDPGSYVFTLTPSSTRDLRGPNVFEVRAMKSSITQQVVPLGYFTVSPTVACP